MVSQEGAQPNVLHHTGTVLVRLGSGGGSGGESWKRKAEEVRSGTERAQGGELLGKGYGRGSVEVGG